MFVWNLSKSYYNLDELFKVLILVLYMKFIKKLQCLESTGSAKKAKLT